MAIGKRIKEARLNKNMTQEELAKLVGVTKGAIANYENNTSHPKELIIYSLMETLGVDANFLFQDNVKTKKSPLYSSEAMRLARDYDEKLDTWGRKQVRDVADNEIARCEDETRFLAETTPDLEPEPKVIPLFWSAPAAGIASPIFGEDYDMYELQPDDPQGAMFAVKVSGDSMEPHFPDGSIAFCNKDPLADGDIGVFSIDGGGVIKQYYYDPMLKMTYLFSLNRKRSDADVLITSTSGQTLACLGRVITRRRFPIPGR